MELGASQVVLADLGISAIIGLALTVISVALSIVQTVLAPKPKLPKEPQAAGHTLTQRQPTAPRRIIYGEARVGGTIVYIANPRQTAILHVMAVVAAHECEALGTVFLGDYPVFTDQIGTDGAVGGRWLVTLPSGSFFALRVAKGIGTTDQVADAWLVANSGGEWTENHRLLGHAWVRCTYVFQENVYAAGLPNMSVLARGKKVYDPRDAGTRWSPNPALCIRDYLLDTTYGLSALAEEIDETSFIAAANVCDEFVNTPTTGDAAQAHTVSGVSTSGDYVQVDGEALKFQRGDRLEVTSDDTVPTGIPSPAYAVPVHERREDRPDGTKHPARLAFASSYANALAGTVEDITDEGAGTITVTKTGEPRYTLNGSFTLDQQPRKVLEDILTSCGGRLVYSGGKFRLLGLAWAAPTLPLDEDDLRGPLKVQTKRPRRDRFNAIKGKYISPLNDWIEGDYPILTNATYEAQDGIRIFADFDQPYTSRSGQAQRLAKLELARNRFERTVTFPAKLTAYDCKAGEVIKVTNSRWEWIEKPFEVVEWRPVIEEDGDGRYLGIDLVLRETDEGIYDWASTEEQTDPPVISPTLPDYGAIDPPGAPEVSEALYEGRDGSDVKARVTLTWAASPHGLVTRYETEFKLSSDAETAYRVFAPQTTAQDLTAERSDFEPGTYDFRVRGRTAFDASSAWSVTVNKVVFGLSEAPAALAGLTLQKLSGNAILRWDLPEELDVLRGGHIEFRWSPVESGATESESTTIGDRIDGRTTQAILPLKAGTYFARAVDKIFNPGPFTGVSTDGATALEYGAVNNLTEDPTFSGTKTNCAESGGVLSLSGIGLFGDIPLLSAVPSVANWGGTATSGLYEFSGGFDFTTPRRVRLRSHVLALVANEADTIGARLTNISEWESFVGDTAPGAGDAWIEVRSTDDDPAGSPVTWSSWERLDVAEFNNRAIDKPRLQMRAYDSAYNVLVSELRVFAEEVV